MVVSCSTFVYCLLFTQAQKIQNGFMYLELERECIQLFNIILYFLAFAKIEKNYVQQKTIKLLYLYM